jgi:hypothetical protein
MLAWTTMAIRMGTGFKSSSSQIVIDIGAISSTVVTLSNKVDINAVITHKQ